MEKCRKCSIHGKLKYKLPTCDNHQNATSTFLITVHGRCSRFISDGVGTLTDIWWVLLVPFCPLADSRRHILM